MGNSKLRERQRAALSNLEVQLESGLKTKKGSFTDKVELSDKDIKRINQEMTTLKSRV